MSEEEIIGVVKTHIQCTNAKVINANTKKEYKVSEALQGLLDLYNKEKEKNKELEKKIILDSKPFVLGMISKDEIREFLLNKIRYRQFELQQEYKYFKDDIKLNTLQDIFYELLEEDNK